jgi:hypothetical protein
VYAIACGTAPCDLMSQAPSPVLWAPYARRFGLRLQWRMATAVVLALGACGEETGTHDDLGEACAPIAEACHEVAGLGDAELDECHDIGHDGDEAACEAESERCLAVCAAATES